MQWESLGFKGDPLNTDPILQKTLSLYTGHEDEISSCVNVLNNRNVRIVIEGGRGVGTTSFANMLRFSLQEEKTYFTPRNEIRVEAGWKIETLLAVIVANIVREIEIYGSNAMKKDKRFKSAKSISSQIAKIYRSFGVDAFGFGVNYGENAGPVSQPVIVPSNVLGHHLEDLAKLVESSGYKNGLLLQLNNLDVGEIHDEAEIKYLFNSLRDYAQTDGVSWFLVGDLGLRAFIAQQVDRLDDIISFEIDVNPLSKEDFKKLIEKRIDYYRQASNAKLPIGMDVFLYLYTVTKGRLRYIFGLLSRLMAILHVGDLTDRITLDIAKPSLVKLTKSRLKQDSILPGEVMVLAQLVKERESTPGEIAQKINKSSQYTGRVLKGLVEKKLVIVKKQGVSRYYTPVLDAVIAYSE